MATGSPFDPVEVPGSSDKYIVGECNNVGRPLRLKIRADDQALIYPGLGLGTILANATKMTDKMIVAGSNRLSELAPALKDPKKALLPEFGGALNFRLSP